MPVYLSVSNTTTNEATGFINFLVSLDTAATQTVTVNYATAGMTANSADYTHMSGTLTFLAGITSQTVRIPITADLNAEPVEAMSLQLSSATNAVISKALGIALLGDNDTSATPSLPGILSVRDVSVDEAAGSATFTVFLSRAAADGFNVPYSTTGITATAGADFDASAGVLAFAAGETVKTITIALTNDALAEGAELFELTLGTPSGAGAALVQLGDASATGLISPNDATALAQPLISAHDTAVSEGDTYVDILVTLSAPSASEVRVSYATFGQTAGSSDYDHQSSTLVFTPGQTSQVVRIPIINDAIAENIEMFGLQLSGAVNALLARPEATILLSDNDRAADLGARANLSVRDTVVDEKAGTVSFLVMLDKSVGDSFTVTYASANGNALAGTDYIAASGSITFGAGETVKTITMALTDDSLPELEEGFTMQLGSISGAGASLVQVADGSALALIGRNDQTALALPVITINNPVVSEADGFAEFVLSLSAPSINTVTVNVSNDSLTANSSDYNYTARPVTFAAGVTTQLVRVPLVNDSLEETREVFSLSMSGATNAVIGKAYGHATIIDNDRIADTVNPARMSVLDVAVDEKAGTISFAVVLDKALSNSVSVTYATANGSAVGGVDYTAGSGSITFGAGETAKLITLALRDDPFTEGQESLYLNLGTISGPAAAQVVLGDASAIGLIGASDATVLATPALSVSDALASEGDGYVDFLLNLSAPSTSQVSVSFSTGSLSANSSDYAHTSGTVIFAPGMTQQVVRVAIVDDLLDEPVQDFYLSLGSVTGATLMRSYAHGRIVDNDRLADLTQRANLTVDDLVIDEKAGLATFSVVLDRAVGDTVSVAYATQAGTALAGADYAGVAGSLTFAPGETSKRVTVNIMDDLATENAETFSLVLGAVSGAGASHVLVTDGTGIATIGANDKTVTATPQLSVSDATVGESADYVDFVVTLSAPSASVVSVSYSTSSVTATSSDYEHTSGTVRFAPGVTTQVVRVTITPDLLVESNELYRLTLSSAQNATIVKAVGSGTIIDNDTLADSTSKATLAVSSGAVTEDAGFASFVVTLDKTTSAPFSVAYSTVPGTAGAADYLATSGLLTFAPGETSKTINVALIDDATSEAAETFSLQLGALSGTGASVVNPTSASALATIALNDAGAAAPELSLSASAALAREGSALSFTLNTANVAAGTQFVYQASGLSAGRLAEGASGILTVGNDGKAVLRATLLDNGVVNGDETLSFSINGSSASVSVTVSDALASTGTALGERLMGTAGADSIDGLGGRDIMVYSGTRADYTIVRNGDSFSVTERGGATDVLSNVERIEFADATYALDISGVAGQVYRVYQAAFDRTPDLAGVGYWIANLDNGVSIRDVAAAFMQSAEFASVYGSANPNAVDFVTRLYENVLHRPYEQAGFDFWVGALNNGYDPAAVLALFAESAENQDQVIGTIGNGFEYIPFG